MKIAEKIKQKGTLFSFEVFPPKYDHQFDSIENAITELSKLDPDFISVTYGAGGGTSANTIRIASDIKNKLGVDAIAHLTCISTPVEKIDEYVSHLKANGIENILALRGDRPPEDFVLPEGRYFEHASDLASYLKDDSFFCLGGACYPEGHTECETLDKDLDNLKIKADSGVEFLTTQLFYDNNAFYTFIDKARAKGINLPVLAGIMPVTNYNSIERTIKLSGTSVPADVSAFLSRYKDDPESLLEAGMEYACNQIKELLDFGVDGIHIYTMNKPFIAERIVRECRG